MIRLSASKAPLTQAAITMVVVFLAVITWEMAVHSNAFFVRLGISATIISILCVCYITFDTILVAIEQITAKEDNSEL